MFSKTTLAKMIDYSLLRPDATEEQVIRFCQDARNYHFASVAVLPSWLPVAAQQLTDSDINLVSVVAFPLGSITTNCKVFEAKQAIEQGAGEIDMMINIGALKSGHDEVVRKDIEEVVSLCKLGGLTEEAEEVLVKVIIETSLLTRSEQQKVCKMAEEVRADFIKTSTGLGPKGVTVDDVKFIRQLVGKEMGVKAAGGIRTLDQALAMINAGADRLGTSSGTVIIDAYDLYETPEELIR